MLNSELRFLTETHSLKGRIKKNVPIKVTLLTDLDKLVADIEKEIFNEEKKSVQLISTNAVFKIYFAFEIIKKKLKDSGKDTSNLLLKDDNFEGNSKKDIINISYNKVEK